MTPFFWNTKNFGDHMNSWLWNELFPGQIDAERKERLVGIGTLIASDLAIVPGAKKICGSGAGNGPVPTKEGMKDWKIYFVRGPRTQKALELAESYSVVDAAWMIGLLPEFTEIPEKSGTIFVPHWKSAESGVWKSICDRSSIEYIDPLEHSKTVINKIAHAKLAIVEAMHGSIIADYYRTPWIPVSSGKNVLSFKWMDWCESVGLEYRPTLLPPSDYFDFLWRGQKPEIAGTEVVQLSPKPKALSVGDAARSTPSTFYVLKSRAKPIIRNARRVAWESSQGLRNVWPIGGWNERHIDNISTVLQRLSSADGILSDDRVRDEKLARLSEIANDIRNGK